MLVVKTDLAICFPAGEKFEIFADELDTALSDEDLSISIIQFKDVKTALEESYDLAKFRLLLVNPASYEKLKKIKNRKMLLEQTTLIIKVNKPFSNNSGLFAACHVMRGCLNLRNTTELEGQVDKACQFVMGVMKENKEEQQTSDSDFTNEVDSNISVSGSAEENETDWFRCQTETRDPISSKSSPQREQHHEIINQVLEMPRTESSNSWILPIFTVAVFVVAVLFSTRNAQEERELTIREKFEERIDVLKTNFPHQDTRLWRTVKAVMRKHIVDEDPGQPAVLMLVSGKAGAKVREELSKEIAKAYSVRCSDNEPVIVRGSDHAVLDHAVAKKEIDDVITAGLSKSSSVAVRESPCVAVISNLQLLPPASTTVFYQFCENDLAPFKKVAIIFTLEISPGSWDTSDRYQSFIDKNMTEYSQWDRIVDEYLTYNLQAKDKSGIMTKDMIGGLLSRITPAVAWVRDQ